MNNIKPIESCLICKNPILTALLDLGNQALANSYIKNKESEELEFPLALNLCEHCYHVQLTHSVNPDLLFRNYLYVSGTSNTFNQYLKFFASPYLKESPKKVLEIACNDGSLLKLFKDAGWSTFGVDPAINLKPLVEEKGLSVLAEYWNLETAKFLNQKFDLIIAMHVLPHVPDPVEFILACKEVLADNGRIVLQTSQCEMFQNFEYDCTYHEHCSYFSAKSFKKLAEICGLKCSSSYKANIHGKSYVVTFSNVEDNTLNQIELDEANIGRYTKDFYNKFSNKAFSLTKELKESIDSYRNQGYTIVGFGAAAKGNTVLNFGDIHLDYIVDDNPLKWNYYTPGIHTIIKNPDCISREHNKCLFVILAWNFYNEIKYNILKRRSNPDDKFITYFPAIKIQNNSV